MFQAMKQEREAMSRERSRLREAELQWLKERAAHNRRDVLTLGLATLSLALAMTCLLVLPLMHLDRDLSKYRAAKPHVSRLALQ